MSTEHTTARVSAAQMIRRYQAPQWLVEPVGEPSEPHDIANINASHPYVLQTGIIGWGEYDAIIRVPLPCAGDVDYLASLDPAQRRD